MPSGIIVEFSWKPFGLVSKPDDTQLNMIFMIWGDLDAKVRMSWCVMKQGNFRAWVASSWVCLWLAFGPISLDTGQSLSQFDTSSKGLLWFVRRIASSFTSTRLWIRASFTALKPLQQPIRTATGTYSSSNLFLLHEESLTSSRLSNRWFFSGILHELDSLYDTLVITEHPVRCKPLATWSWWSLTVAWACQ